MPNQSSVFTMLPLSSDVMGVSGRYMVARVEHRQESVLWLSGMSETPRQPMNTFIPQVGRRHGGANLAPDGALQPGATEH